MTFRFEVINCEKQSNSLGVSKALVNTLNIKHGEVVEQLKQSTNTVEEHENTLKALMLRTPSQSFVRH